MAGKTKAAEKAKQSKTAVKPQVLTSVPEWSNVTAIAKLLGKSTRRIYQLTQDGVLQTEVPPGGGARKYPTCATIQKYLAYVEERANDSGKDGKIAELALKKLEAEVALKESQGHLHRLKTAIAEGKYIAADEAEAQLTEYMLSFRRLVADMPGRVARSIPEQTDVVLVRNLERAMRRELEKMLETFVDAAEVLEVDNAAEV